MHYSSARICYCTRVHVITCEQPQSLATAIAIAIAIVTAIHHHRQCQYQTATLPLAPAPAPFPDSTIGCAAASQAGTSISAIVQPLIRSTKLAAAAAAARGWLVGYYECWIRCWGNLRGVRLCVRSLAKTCYTYTSTYILHTP